MMLMFMVIMMTAQPALETVLEEKSNRIAEVLLGSASPFQLMAGKLLGTVAGSVCILSVYLLGGLGVAWYKDWFEFVPWGLVPWFVAYQILAVLFFNSIFLAIGASVNQLKEAQSLLLPVWLLMALPMFVWFNLVREPNGKLATWLSFFPPSTPLVMTLRLGSQTAVPVWQPIAGFAVMLLATLVGVYLAGRIFRVGILWQGAAPKLRDLARWALSG
jgi:ABC-2 type transport system permease protein